MLRNKGISVSKHCNYKVYVIIHTFYFNIPFTYYLHTY